MKTEIKNLATSTRHRLIMYPDGLPSTGYVMTRQDLYALYVELRDMFVEGPPEEDTEDLGLSLDE